MPDPITKRQAEVLAYIVAHQAQHERPPTRAEIAAHFGWASANAAEEHVQRLQAKGYLALPGRGHGTHSVRNIKVNREAIEHVGPLPPAAPPSGPRPMRVRPHTCEPGESVCFPCVATNYA